MFPVGESIKDIRISARPEGWAHRLDIFAHDIVMAAASFAISLYLHLGAGARRLWL